MDTPDMHIWTDMIIGKSIRLIIRNTYESKNKINKIIHIRYENPDKRRPRWKESLGIGYIW